MFIRVIFQIVSGECLFKASVLFRYLGSISTFIYYFLPIIILSYCYGRIVWMLTRRIDSNLGNTGSQTDTFQMARTNTIKTFLWVTLFFVICWSGNQVFYLMANLGYSLNFNGLVAKVTTVVAFCNCTVNPFIYVIKYKDYQTALRELFKCKTKSEVDESGLTRSKTIISAVTISTNGL